MAALKKTCEECGKHIPQSVEACEYCATPELSNDNKARLKKLEKTQTDFEAKQKEVREKEEKRDKEARHAFLRSRHHPEASRGRYVLETEEDYLRLTIKNCIHCDKEINISATYCKFCQQIQAKENNEKQKTNLLLGLVAGLGLSYVLIKQKNKRNQEE